MTKQNVAEIYREKVWILKVSQQMKSAFSFFSQSSSQPYSPVSYLIFLPIAPIFLITFSLLTLLLEGDSILATMFPAYVMLAIILVMIFIQAERDISTTIRIVEDYKKTPNSDPEFQDKVIKIPQNQLLIGIIVTIILIPIYFISIDAVYENQNTGYVFILALILVSIIVFTALYGGNVGSYYFAYHLPDVNFHLHKFMPNNSPIIRKISKPFEGAFIAQSTAASIIILGIVISKPSALTFLIATVASIIAIFILVFSLLNSRRFIRQIIDKARDQTLDEINEKILEIYNSEQEIDSKQKNLDLYFDLYDKSSREIAYRIFDWNSILGFYRVLLFPFITLVITNFDVTRDILIAISNFISHLII